MSEEIERDQKDSVRVTRRQQAQVRRKQIVEAAVRLFAHYGFDGTSTRQIAQEVHITEGLIFHYFPTKADILAAVLETHHVFLGTLRTILADEYDQPAVLLLPRIAQECLLTLRREAAFASVLVGTAQTNLQMGDLLQVMIQQGIAHLATYLSGRVQAGELRADLPLETSAQVFFSSLFIFFLTSRTLNEGAWEACAATFIQEMFSTWFTGTRS